MNSKKPKYRVDITGERYGKLVVLERAEPVKNPNNSTVQRWICKCDCGNITTVRYPELKCGKTLSCGCYHKEVVSKTHKTHGLSSKNKRLYKIWKEMRYRCSNPNNKSYARYGGRGIRVCDEWNKSFSAFYEWSLSNGYQEDIRESGINNITIDRIDVNGNYEPSNCRYVSNRENCLNKRNTLKDYERYVECPICGKTYEKTQRNSNKTCSKECGTKLRLMTRRLYATTEYETSVCHES